jgi:hypothetical protein
MRRSGRPGNLERWLDQDAYPHTRRDIDFLKRLQRLCSKLAAHRKGSDYAQVLASENVDDDRIAEIVQMLNDSCAMLESLATHFGVDLSY